MRPLRKPLVRSLSVNCFLLLVISTLFACASDEIGNFDGEHKVTDVNIIANNIEVGESVRVEVFFEDEVDFRGEPDDIDLVVQLSSALRYELDSAALYDDSTDDWDRRPPDDVVHCPDGRTFLVFHYTEDDLEDRSISGLTGFGMRFGAIGDRPTSVAIISAAAAQNQEFSCLADFQAESDESVEVLTRFGD